MQFKVAQTCINLRAIPTCLCLYHRVAINNIVLPKSIMWVTPWCAVGSQTPTDTLQPKPKIKTPTGDRTIPLLIPSIQGEDPTMVVYATLVKNQLLVLKATGYDEILFWEVFQYLNPTVSDSQPLCLSFLHALVRSHGCSYRWPNGLPGPAHQARLENRTGPSKPMGPISCPSPASSGPKRAGSACLARKKRAKRAGKHVLV
jgi:hypothetical protein